MQPNIKRLLTLFIALAMVSSGFVVFLHNVNVSQSGKTQSVTFSVPKNGLIGNYSDGSNAYGGAYDPYNQELYITNDQSNNVTVVNSFSGVSVANISVGSEPEGITYVPYNHDIYVDNYKSSNISVISSSTNKVVNTINVSGEPQFSAYDPITQILFVTSLVSSYGEINLVNVTNNNVTVFPDLPFSATPFGLAFDPYNKNMYVADYHDNEILVISPSGQITGYISVGQNPYGLAFDTLNKMLYVTDFDFNGIVSGNPQQYNLSVVNTVNNTLVKNVPMQKSPEGILYDPMNGLIYVSEYLSGNVSVLNPSTNSVTQILPAKVGTQLGPDVLVYDPVLQQVISINDVSGIDVTKNFNSAGGFAGPFMNSTTAGAVVFDPNNNLIYSAPTGTQLIDIYSLSGILLSKIVLNGSVSALAYGNNTIFAASGSINQIYLIGALNDTVYKTLTYSVYKNPDGLAYDSLNNTLFISFSSNNDVGVLDLNNYTLIRNLEVGISPGPLTFSKKVDQVFVAQEDENIHIINASSYANVYPYSVVGSSPSQVAYDPYTNSIYIANYGNNSMFVINDSRVNFQFDQSTPYRTVYLGSGQQGISFDPSNGLIYILQSGSKNVTIFNPIINQAVGSINSSTLSGEEILTYIPDIEAFMGDGGQAYANMISTSKLFAVSIRVGDQIPAGNTWSLQIQPSIDSTFAKIITSGQSSNKTFYTSLPNGTYYLNVTTSFSGVHSFHGYFVINGSSTSILLYFYENVIFNENGLTPGVAWSVSVGGNTYTSASNNITLKLTPGKYNTYISGSTGYQPYPSSMVLDVPEHAINQSIYFQSPDSRIFGSIDNTTSLSNGTIYSGDSFIPVTSSELISGGAYDPAYGLMLIMAKIGNSFLFTLYNTTDYEYILSGDFLANSNFSYTLDNPRADYFDPVNSMFYVIGNNNAVASVYPSNGTIESVVQLPGELLPTIQGIGNMVYTANTTGTVFAINILNESVKDFNLNVTINGSVMIPYNNNLFLLNDTGSSLIELNTLTGSLTQIYFSGGFDAVHVIAGKPGTLYISGSDGAFVEVFNESTRTISSSIDLESSLGGLNYSGNFITDGIYDPINGLMYFSSGASPSEYSFGNFTVYVPSTGQVVSSFPGLNSSSSIYMIFDSSIQKIFAVGVSSNTMTVISTLEYYNVTVKESGLPSGTSWTLKLSDGRTFTTTGDSITFLAENNFSYSYTVQSSNTSLKATPGTFTADGNPVNIDVAFTLLKFNVSISETGLTPGTRWFVDINGTLYNSTTDVITVQLPNGSYSYRVQDISGFILKNGTGTIPVNGGASVEVKFTKTTGISTSDEIIIASGVAIVAVAGGIAFVFRGRKGK